MNGNYGVEKTKQETERTLVNLLWTPLDSSGGKEGERKRPPTDTQLIVTQFVRFTSGEFISKSIMPIVFGVFGCHAEASEGF